jgi:Coenzyme PQQ synthesis protein D (PqqD)
MSMIEPGSKIRRSPQVAARELSAEEGAVLLHLETAQYHGINPVGLAIWELLDGDRTVTDVVAAVRAQVQDPPPQLEDDVLEFLNDVLERGLVVVD